MATFFFLPLVLLISQSFLLTLSSGGRQSKLETSPFSITAAPALLPDSPYQELSPDVAPLLPSSGGVVPSPTESSLPIIPSNPSPPNPDNELVGPLDSAFAPFGALPGSSAVRLYQKGSVNVAMFFSFMTWWLLMVLAV